MHLIKFMQIDCCSLVFDAMRCDVRWKTTTAQENGKAVSLSCKAKVVHKQQRCDSTTSAFHNGACDDDKQSTRSRKVYWPELLWLSLVLAMVMVMLLLLLVLVQLAPLIAPNK